MTGNRTKRNRSPFGDKLHTDFLDRDNITQAQLAKISGIDATVISRMVHSQRSYSFGKFAQGETLAEQLYAILNALKKRYIHLPSDTIRELLQTIPHANLTDTERESLIAKLIQDNIVTPVYYFTEQGRQQHLIGRHEDIQAILEQLTNGKTQLVTMVGLPGVGKTRLAEQIQEQARRVECFAIVYPFISFDETIDSEEVIRRIRDQRHGEAPRKRALIILDNCEQIADRNHVRGKIVKLLQKNPQLTILAISTIAFVEQPYLVKPLAVPEHQNEPRYRLRTYAAVQYFLDRAGVDNQPYELTEDNAEKIAALCIALDGLPLALKIIASWVREVGIDKLYTSLFDKSVYMLQYAFNDIERHISLNVAMAWSYNKLQPDEQKLFRRLAIFASSCSLEALSAVCNVDNDLPIDLPAHKATLLTMLKTLENHSFITFLDGRVSISHTTLNQFAKQELDQDEKAYEVKNQFAFYYSEQVEKYMAARYKIGQLGVEIDIDEYIASEKYRKFKTPFDDMEFDDPAHYDRDTHREAREEKEAEYWSTRPFLVDEFDNLLAADEALREMRKATIEHMVMEDWLGEKAYQQVMLLREDLEKRENLEEESLGYRGEDNRITPSVTWQRMDAVMQRLTGNDYHSDYDIVSLLLDLKKRGYSEESEEVKNCFKFYTARQREFAHSDITEMIGISVLMLYLWDDLFLFELTHDVSPSILKRRKLRTKRYNSYPRLDREEGGEGVYIILTSPHDLP